jgi:phosphatidylglycerol lysyltransferase
MTARFKSLIGFAISVGLFAAAAWMMRHELRAYHFEEVIRAFHTIPRERRIFAFFLTMVSYWLMTGYDTLALRYIRHPLPRRKIFLASFTGYAFSNNIGLSMLAGASVRYRLYSAWGLSTVEIAQVVGFCALSMWIGFFFLNGLVFVFSPTLIGTVIHLPVYLVRIFGLILLGLTVVYTGFSFSRKSSLRLLDWDIAVPSPVMAVSQIVVGLLDWTLAGYILYIMLSHFAVISFTGFMGVYLAAQLVGLFSQVPGGLGVFETLIVLSLSSRIAAPHILGALIAFRLIYYWAPLGLAALLLGAQEILRGKAFAGRFIRLFDRWVSPVVPNVIGLMVFIGGAILLFSGATPEHGIRLETVKSILPLSFLEVSHFIGSIAGMGLLLLGRGLQRRLDAAYLLSTVLLGFGIVASIFKGFDVEEAFALAMILAALVPSRRHFYRKTSLLSQPFNGAWISAILIVLGCSVWLGFYAYRHVEYADSLWWQFTFYGNASRFLRATLGAVVFGLFFSLARLLSPAKKPPHYPPAEEIDAVVKPIVAASRNTNANLALLGDKMVLLNADETAFIMYRVEGRSWIAMGDPVGPEGEWSDLIWQFRELADEGGGWPVFYEIGHENLHLYPDAGFSLIKLGEEARVPLSDFTLEGGGKKGLRNNRNKIEKLGYRFSVLATEDVSRRMDELKAVSDAWLIEKNTPEKGFSLGFFKPEYLSMNPVAIVEKDGIIAAFANVWIGADRQELTVDLMRFHPEMQSGVMDYLFIEMMVWGKEMNFKWFNLGMAPLSGLEARSMAPFWTRLGAFVYHYGEHFYNFQGLRLYKEKFDPVWVPRYLASPGGLVLPRVFTNLATLISGGVKGIIMG